MITHRAVRGRLLTFLGDPAEVGATASHRYTHDGLVVIEDGLVTAVGDASALLPTLPTNTPVDHYPDHLVLPGPYRHPHPLPADAGDRLLRCAAAGMAAEIHLRRGAEIQ